MAPDNRTIEEIKNTTCLNAIDSYINAQAAKGLVEVSPKWYAHYCTHWGMHIEVILPEIERIAAHYQLQLRVKTMWLRENGMNEVVAPTTRSLEKTAYVEADIWLDL